MTSGQNNEELQLPAPGVGLSTHAGERLLRLGVVFLIGLAAIGQQALAQADSSSTVQRALHAPDLTWIRRETRHATIYAIAGPWLEARLPGFVRETDQAISDHRAWLGGAPLGDKLQIFLVGSRQHMQRLTGSDAAGWSIPSEGAAFMVANDSLTPAIRHETMHLVSWRLWGAPPANWLSEGLATAAKGACRGRSVGEIVSAINQAGALVSMDSLRHHFSVSGALGAAHYFASASLILYIDKKYGRERLRELWSAGGLAAAPTVLGVDVPTLDREWRVSIARSRASFSWEAWWSDTQLKGCG